MPAGRAAVLPRRGRALEVITLGGNVAGIMVLAVAALGARSAVLAGLALNPGAGLWRADPLAALVIVFYARREARAIFLPGPAGVEHSP